MKTLAIHNVILAAGADPEKLPSTLVYLPAGEHQIAATVNGKPGRARVVIEASAASLLQAHLEQLRATGSEPFGDFDHAEGAASYIPQAFRWEAAQGVVVDVEWTGAGRAAVANKDYRYHSAAFLTESPQGGKVVGLAGRCVGSLVNRPAFQALGKIAARQAAEPTPAGGDPDGTTQDQQPMNKNATAILAALATARVLTADEAEKDDASTILAKRLSDDFVPKATHDAVTAELATIKAAAADAAIAAAEKRGAIKAADTTKKEWWKKQLTTGTPADIQAAQAMLESIAPARTAPRAIVNASQAEAEDPDKPATDAAAIRAKQREAVEAIQAREPGMPFDRAWNKAVQQNPELFAEGK